ncbi:MAG: sulfatase-like hydrolase/transferase [Phycisphaerae bacterium]|nr:sulfatase-like hydrolase/transferase [Phycisphaerae bacterium]
MKPKDHKFHLFVILGYIVLLINLLGLLRYARFGGLYSSIFSIAVWLPYGALYLFIALVPALIVMALAKIPPISATLQKCHLSQNKIKYISSLTFFSIANILLYADSFIYGNYGFHFNSFIWNLITTPGGLESMGSSAGTTFVFVLICLCFPIIHGLLLLLVHYPGKLKLPLFFLSKKPFIKSLIIINVVCFAFQTVGYGLSEINPNPSIYNASQVFPVYFPVTFKSIAKKFGVVADRSQEIKIKDIASVQYPLKELNVDPNHKKYNIVWLVAESWRWDMLDPEISPNTWNFAQESINFKHHYSGGNGTRMAMFSMFYGLYGNYWFPFLKNRIQPLIMQRLIEDGYQMKMFTSARFSYPEFDQTIFASIPEDFLVQAFGSGTAGWQRDQEFTGEMLNFIENRDKNKPFMTFMFYESPHARYYFPPESVIRQPYLEDFNYATVDLENDIELIKNRYINSCHHLDSQLGRVIDYLKNENLLDSTIVIMVGDHGEEFMENGRWGHNSTYSDYQTRTPMIMHVPGQQARSVQRITCHLDIPGAILDLMGVQNPIEDYSLGGNILKDTQSQPYYVMAGWSRLCYMDNQYKATFSLKSYNVAGMDITTIDDKPVPTQEFFDNRKAQVLDMMLKTNKFTK